MKAKFLIGAILMFFSYFSYLLPDKLLCLSSTLLLFFIFVIGLIFICEGITIALRKKSLVNEISRNKKNLLAFLLVSIIGALMIEIVANYTGKLWFYPRLNFYIYSVLFIPMFTVYWLVIAESYLAAKAMIDYFIKGKKIITAPSRVMAFILKLMGVIGIIILAGVIGFIISDFIHRNQSLYIAQDIFVVSSHYRINFLTIMLIFIGIWFTLEFLEYLRGKSSLMKDLLHGYYAPILAILLGSSITAILMETQNIPAHVWVYINWPYEQIKLFGLPAMVYFGWPLHYITFLSLFRFLTSKESEEIWQGDLIK